MSSRAQVYQHGLSCTSSPEHLSCFPALRCSSLDASYNPKSVISLHSQLPDATSFDTPASHCRFKSDFFLCKSPYSSLVSGLVKFDALRPSFSDFFSSNAPASGLDHGDSSSGVIRNPIMKSRYLIFRAYPSASNFLRSSQDNSLPRLSQGKVLHSYRPSTIRKRWRINASSDEKAGSEANPPRITSNLRSTLNALKLLKEYRKSSAEPTRYRKKKTVKSNVEDENERDYFIEDLYFGGDRENSVLLVDGYNICGYWPKLKKAFSKGQLDVAREKLISELITFSGVRGVKVVVVFDAFLSGLASSKEELYNIEVVYSAASDADTWIEREVRILRERGMKKIWVASSDSLLATTAFCTGALVWSSANLVSEIKEAHRELQEIIEEETQKHTFKGKRLEHNLDKKTYDDLLHLRKELVSKNRYW